MSQAQKAVDFAKLHVSGQPLVLYNIWDAGGAKVLAKAGAKAVATGSWSVAAAQGYPDGQKIPMDFLLRIAGRIAETVDLPLTVDFEGCYAETPDEVAANVTRVIEAGAVGINFEDQVVGGEGLHALEAQSERIAAARQAAEAAGAVEFVQGFFVPAEAGQGGAPVEKGGGVVWFLFQGLLEMAQGFQRPAAARQAGAPVDPGVHVLRVGSGDAGEVIGGLLVAFGPIGGPSFLVNLLQLFCILGVERHRLLVLGRAGCQQHCESP